MNSLDSTLNTNNSNFQSIIESSKLNIVETVKSTINQLLVPAVESIIFFIIKKKLILAICSQLFEQLNDTFRDGLQEFMDQINLIQKENTKSLTPSLLSDHTNLIHLIEAGQTSQAFEIV